MPYYIRAGEIGPFASRLSMSLKVIEGDTGRQVTCDFLLVSTVSEINSDFGGRTQIFSYPCT